MARNSNPFTILHPLSVSALLQDTVKNNGTLSDLLTRLESWRWEDNEVLKYLTKNRTNEHGAIFHGSDLKKQLSDRIGAVRTLMTKMITEETVKEAEKQLQKSENNFTLEEKISVQNAVNNQLDNMYPTFTRRDRQSSEVKQETLNHLRSLVSQIKF